MSSYVLVKIQCDAKPDCVNEWFDSRRNRGGLSLKFVMYHAQSGGWWFGSRRGQSVAYCPDHRPVVAS